MGTAGLCMLMLTGCGGKDRKTYDQAVADLEQGSYDYALEGYKSSITAGYKSAQSYRGAGIACLHLGNYQDAIDYLTSGLNDEKAGKTLKKDMLAYRATAELKSELFDAAMADCQTIAEDYTMDADTYYLTGCVALTMRHPLILLMRTMPIRPMRWQSRSTRHILKKTWRQTVHVIWKLH